MASLTYQKTANATCLLGVASAIIMPDVVFGLLVELFHVALECAHLIFEVFESALDHAVEHTFHTETHDTQLIVFYTITAMATTGLYFLCRKISRFFRSLIGNLVSAWFGNKTRLKQYWAESASNKFKLIAMFNAGLTACYLYFQVMF